MKSFSAIRQHLVASNFVFFVVVAATCVYFLIVADDRPEFTLSEDLKPSASAEGTTCDLFRGQCVRNEKYPLDNTSRCPFANGWKDADYMKLQWKPEGCDVPRFKAREALKNLRGKQVVFVGDSLSRTQWESFICMLMMGVDNKRSIYEINGHEFTRQIRFLGVNFSSFDLRVDFYQSVFLVRQGRTQRHAAKWVRQTLFGTLIPRDNLSYIGIVQYLSKVR